MRKILITGASNGLGLALAEHFLSNGETVVINTRTLTTANLTEKKMNECLKNDKAQDDILNQRIEGQKKYKIESTPTIYINEKKYTGKVDYKKFKKSIEKEI